MNLIDLIGERQGGQGLAALGRQFGLDDSQSRAAIEELAPVVMAGLRQETQSADGLSGLIGALARGRHARYIDEDDQDIAADGNAILGHVFGSKDVSRGVAAQASQRSGIDSAILKQMLPVIAAMVMGALAKNANAGRGTGASAGGGLGDILGQVLGGQSAGASSGGGLGDLLGQVLGGQPVDAPSDVRVGENAGRVRRGPAADQGGGLGDILGDLLGGGAGGQSGRTVPQAGTSDIGGILDSIFGGNARPEVRAEATRRAGDAFGGMLGAGTQRGMDADALLESARRAARGR